MEITIRYISGEKVKFNVSNEDFESYNLPGYIDTEELEEIWENEMKEFLWPFNEDEEDEDKLPF